MVAVSGLFFETILRSLQRAGFVGKHAVKPGFEGGAEDGLD